MNDEYTSDSIPFSGSLHGVDSIRNNIVNDIASRIRKLLKKRVAWTLFLICNAQNRTSKFREEPNLHKSIGPCLPFEEV